LTPALWVMLLRHALRGASAQVLSRSGALRGRSLLGREPWPL